MKRCLACQQLYSRDEERCRTCDFAPTRVDGFPAYAPELAAGGGGFKASYFADLARLEERNFWFRARNALIVWAIKKYCPNFRSFLEIGCGTGYVLAGIAEAFPEVSFEGSEVFAAGLTFAAARVPAARFIQMDARRIPYRDEFDAIGAFDVLEHIEEDDVVLAEACAALKPGGVLLLTVPQHDWLWSPADDYACHVRRYAAGDIHAKLRSAGFEILRSTSFVSLLLPAMLLSRVRTRSSDAPMDPTAELKLPDGLNTLLYKVMMWEVGLIRTGVNMPVGGSRLVVARRVS